MSPSRARSRAAVVLATTTVALAASVTVASTASAHVTVSSPDAAPGGYGKLVFRVPNESDTASTVALRIQIPADAAMASLRVQPVPGWTATLTNSDLAEPLEAHGQEITSYVSVVEFRAEPGNGIAPGQFQEFALSGGAFPEEDQLSFPAVQTYSDGTESAWIEPTVEGEAEPERPAPVLQLSAASESAHGGESTAGASADAEADDDGSSGTATTALVLAVVGLLAGVGGLALGWSARRRTVAP
ncbi:YcnI family copper-binding membrane protein [Blastococcus sp. SYSU D01042]